MKLPIQNRSTASIFVVLFLGLSAVYLIPFNVPVHDGLSDSYIFGFNNRTAALLMAAFTLGFAFWTRGLGLSLPKGGGQSRDAFHRTTAIAIAVVVVIASLVWLLAKELAPAGESQYFLDRYAMFRLGGRLYRDFEFDYGPLMFYPALWIARLGRISIGNAFYLTWILQWGFGTWLMSWVISTAAEGTKHGRAVFLLLWVFFLSAIVDSGPNYTPLRFCGTLAFALGVHFLFDRGASNIATFGLACIGATVMLFYSPEQGIAFTIGTILFFVTCVRPARMDLLGGVAGFIIAMIPVFWLALRLGDLDNIRTVGGGSLNFPILFSFQSLVLLVLLIVAGCALIASFRMGRSQGLLSYLICLSLVSAPAAFSRADYGHIIINTLGALIAALVVLSQYPAVWRWTWPSFALVIILFGYSHLGDFAHSTRDQFRAVVFHPQYYSAGLDRAYTLIYRATHKNPQSRLDQRRASAALDLRPNAPRLPSQIQLLAPFGIRRRIDSSDNPTQIITGRYPWLFPVTSTRAIDDKVAELRAHPDWPLVIPFSDKASCLEDLRELRKGLKKMLMVPYVPKPRNTVSAAAPLCDYINANYAVSDYATPELGDFIWLPKEHVSAIAAASDH